MTTLFSDLPVSPLRQNLIDHMNMRKFSTATHLNCITVGIGILRPVRHICQ